jgi:hypothetical protein
MELEMNERIKELALQCGAWHQVYDNKRFIINGKFDVEQFADLIIWECMKTCENVMEKDNSALACWSEIKRTFRN